MPTRISILQVSTISHCFIIDLLNFYQKPSAYRACWARLVREVFENEKIIKIGFGIHHDLENLRAATGAGVALLNTLDLSKFSAQLIVYFGEQDLRAFVDGPKQAGIQRFLMNMIMRCRERDFRQQGLAQLTYVLFGKELDKSEQMSNWNRRPLRREQYVYAALDAFCLVDIFETLMMLNNQLLHFESVQALLQAVKMYCSGEGAPPAMPGAFSSSSSSSSRHRGAPQNGAAAAASAEGGGGGGGDKEASSSSNGGEEKKRNANTARGKKNRRNRQLRKNNAAAAAAAASASAGNGGPTSSHPPPGRLYDRNQFE